MSKFEFLSVAEVVGYRSIIIWVHLMNIQKHICTFVFYSKWLHNRPNPIETNRDWSYELPSEGCILGIYGSEAMKWKQTVSMNKQKTPGHTSQTSRTGQLSVGLCVVHACMRMFSLMLFLQKYVHLIGNYLVFTQYHKIDNLVHSQGDPQGWSSGPHGPISEQSIPGGQARVAGPMMGLGYWQGWVTG